MKILYISGSHRKKSNVDLLLKHAKEITGGEFLRLADFNIKYCGECWNCLRTGKCAIPDDMTNILIPKLLEADAIILGTPVFFNNVSARLKNFIDRTWCIKGGLRDKIGGIIVAGRAYGHQGAIDAITSFYLKHEIIPANRGVSGFGHVYGDILKDPEAVGGTEYLAHRILYLLDKVNRKNN